MFSESINQELEAWDKCFATFEAESFLSVETGRKELAKFGSPLEATVLLLSFIYIPIFEL